MKYVTYYTDNIFYAFIAQDVQQIDTNALEFDGVELLGMLNHNNPEHNGFSGKEKFFIFYSEDEEELDMDKLFISNEMSPFMQAAMGKIVDGILPKNYLDSLRALFGEENFYGNN